jgi:O-antigen/teichoic acid export membrane protein
MISKRFLKSSAVYSIIGSSSLAWSVILLPFYTQLLMPADFGKLALYTGFSFLIQILVNFSLDSYIVVHYVEYRNDRPTLRDCMATITWSLLGLAVFYILLSLLAGDLLFRFVFRASSLSFFPYGFMSVVTAICNSFFKTYTNLLIYQQKLRRFFWVNIFNFVLTIGISLAGLYLFPYTLIGPMWGRLLSGAGIFLLTFGLMISEFGLGLQRRFFREMVDYCYPMVLYALMIWVLTYFDRFIINHFLHSEDVAVYDVAVKCTLLLEFMQGGLANAIYPQVFRIWRSPQPDLQQVNKYFTGFSAVTLFAIPLFVVAMPLLVPLIVRNPTYYNGFPFLLVLSLGFALRAIYNLYLAPFTFFKKTALLPRALFLSAVFQIVLSILLIKPLGLQGAVWANFLAKASQGFFLGLWARPLLPGLYNQTKLIIYPILFIAVAVILHVLSPQYGIVTLLWQMLVLELVVVGLYRQELKMAFGEVRKKWLG